MTKIKKAKYRVYVTSAYYVYDKKIGAFEWGDEEPDEKHVETHDTIEAALESVSEWGSRWVMYNGLRIQDAEGSEVYSDYPALIKCDCCKHEEWDRITSDLRAFKNKDGARAFPALV